MENYVCNFIIQEVIYELKFAHTEKVFFVPDKPLIGGMDII